MDTSQDQSHHLNQLQLQKIAPHLIQASEILQCTALELQQTIERELLENPALEVVELSSDRCSECTVAFGPCTNCPFALRRAPESSTNNESSEDAADLKRSEEGGEPTLREEAERYATEDSDSELDGDYDIGPLLALSELTDPHVKEDFIEDSFDPISLAPSLPSLRDHLLSRLRTITDGDRGHRINEYLVNSLDDRGWLKLDRTEAMVELGITEDLLDVHIAALQTCDPSGIGARDLRECLLLQLQHLEEEGEGHSLAQSIVSNHWELLTQRRYNQLARKTGTDTVSVEAAIRFIQQELSPSPATQYREPWDYKPDSEKEAIKPDVIIRRTQTGFDIEVAGLDLPALHINARYRRMYESIREDRKRKVDANGRDIINGTTAGYSGNNGTGFAAGVSRIKQENGLSLQERKHIAQYVERANLFLKNIQQRKKTIERITRCLIESQQGYIETGSPAFLLPMTRTDLAHQANLHESTVSRALLCKFIQLPTQDVISFDAFFAPASSVKDMIVVMIAQEDPLSPYSDETIRHKLQEGGVTVARRTIVKYRESLRIPASYLRRKH